MEFLSKIYSKYQNTNDLVKFVINGALLGVLWIGFYSVFRNFQFVNDFYEFGVREFTNFLLAGTELALNILGYETTSFGKIVKIVGTPGVFLDRGCLARNLMGLFAGFVLAYPGKIKKKLWYIPFGLVVIIILNIFRLSGLAILTDCCFEQVEFNHHYVFKIVVFGAILLLWYFWVFTMNKKETKPKTT